MVDNMVVFTSVYFLMSHSNKSLDPSWIEVAIHLRQKNCKYHHTQKTLYRVADSPMYSHYESLVGKNLVRWTQESTFKLSIDCKLH